MSCKCWILQHPTPRIALFVRSSIGEQNWRIIDDIEFKPAGCWRAARKVLLLLSFWNQRQLLLIHPNSCRLDKNLAKVHKCFWFQIDRDRSSTLQNKRNWLKQNQNIWKCYQRGEGRQEKEDQVQFQAKRYFLPRWNELITYNLK